MITIRTAIETEQQAKKTLFELFLNAVQNFSVTDIVTLKSAGYDCKNYTERINFAEKDLQDDLQNGKDLADIANDLSEEMYTSGFLSRPATAGIPLRKAEN
jgi:hypothetical protein